MGQIELAELSAIDRETLSVQHGPAGVTGGHWDLQKYAARLVFTAAELVATPEFWAYQLFGSL